MAEHRNGNITIVAGLPEATGPVPDTQRMSLSGKQMLAFRLRKQGWSYRRISDALGISYQQVLDWLEAEGASPPVPVSMTHTSVTVRLAAANQTHSEIAPLAAPSAPPPSVTVELLERLDSIAAEQRAQAAAIAGLERRLIDVVKAEAKSLGKRIADAIKGVRKPDGRA
ncbi:MULTISPECIES: helix-turn-helix domain-containing protein [unclassified Azospirillum]|uniref:helix-turn-helix domain-containing protein n=1 Tax=unclassified Azospirillum TaxID=2630922 RepID=UPI000B72AEC9|nr:MULTISPECIES: helix-turn-helix domain-containing protein [unclassified Azospirillum]SNS12726.1 Homeodomain-like domain-containing protein [Azospirillum sp. RU38E]SNS29754.1 Homeodomain-like domain-containing protein [Azospirillum sp. RU37A]